MRVADDGRFRDINVLDETALNFRRPKPVAGHVEDICVRASECNTSDDLLNEVQTLSIVLYFLRSAETYHQRVQ